MNSGNHLVFLGLGSNIEREVNIRACLQELSNEFGQLSISSVYESESVGFKGEPFFNLVVGLRTRLGIDSLSAKLHQIEDNRGRQRTGPKFSGRTLDIDILLYDQCCGDFHGIRLPRPEIKDNAYVLWPLSEIAGSVVLPGDAMTLSERWSNYDKESQKLWPVEFAWGDVVLPRTVHW